MSCTTRLHSTYMSRYRHVNTDQLTWTIDHQCGALPIRYGIDLDDVSPRQHWPADVAVTYPTCHIRGTHIAHTRVCLIVIYLQKLMGRVLELQIYTHAWVAFCWHLSTPPTSYLRQTWIVIFICARRFHIRDQNRFLFTFNFLKNELCA